MMAIPSIAELRGMGSEERVSHLKNAMIEAVKITLDRDVALFAIGVHEQTVCHRISFHLETLWDSLGEMSIDCEYNRDVGRYKEYDFDVTGRRKRFRPQGDCATMGNLGR